LAVHIDLVFASDVRILDFFTVIKLALLMKNVIILIICLRSKIFYGIPGTKEYIEGTKEGSNNYLKTKLLIC
jgi:hypothetical protein